MVVSALPPDDRRALSASTELATSPAAAPPVPLQLARTLAEAGRGTMVHVDSNGQVRSPMRYHVLTGIAYGTSLGIALVGATLYTTIFGPLWGMLAGLAFGAAFLIGTSRRRRLVRIAALISDGRLDEAEQHCRRVLDGRWMPRAQRATAHHNLAMIEARRGRFEAALEEVRAAIRLCHKALGKNLQETLLAYAEINILVNLGRVGEARGRLISRGAVPEGDYLRLVHWSADLAVQFGEGRATIAEDDLWSRSRAVLGLAGASNLLALCAWAYALHGDDAMSDHLLTEAVDRAAPESTSTFPSLWTWVEGRRPRLEAPAD